MTKELPSAGTSIHRRIGQPGAMFAASPNGPDNQRPADPLRDIEKAVSGIIATPIGPNSTKYESGANTAKASPISHGRRP